MKYLDKSLLEIHELLKSKKIKPLDLVEEAFENIESHKEYNAYITLNKEDEVIIGLPITNDKDCIGIIAATGYGKKVLTSEFPIQGRGGKGVFILKTTPATGDLTGARILTQDDNVLLISKTSSICVSSEEFPLSNLAARPPELYAAASDIILGRNFLRIFILSFNGSSDKQFLRNLLK